MKKLITFLMALCMVQGISRGQNIETSPHNSYRKYIYRLTDAQAERVYAQGMSEDMLTDLVDSAAYDSAYPQTRIGHYATVWTEDNQLVADYWFNTGISINILDNMSDLMIQLRDSAGAIVSDADVMFRGKPLRYDAAQECYIKKKTKKQGSLRVKRGENVAFYDVKSRINSNHLYIAKWKFIYKRPYRYVFNPINKLIFKPIKYVVCFPYRLGKCAITGECWQLRVNINRPYNEARKLIQRIKQGKDQKVLTCSMFLDKPKYRLGDTVHFKTLIWKKQKQKPYRCKSIKVYVAENNYPNQRKEQRKFVGTMKRLRKGSYIHEFVLSDSLGLKLDRRYYIVTYIGDRMASSSEIKYEDYELYSATFTAEGLAASYMTGDTVAFSINGTDANHLPLMGAKLSLSITYQDMHSYDTCAVFIPNSIWTLDTVMPPTGMLKLSLPADMFPRADADYQLMATCNTTDNELHKLHKNFRIDRTTYHQVFTAEDDSIAYTLYKEGKLYHGNGTLTRVMATGQKQTDSIALPYCERVRQDVQRYECSYSSNTDARTLDMVSVGDKITLQHYVTGDSLYVSVSNPRRLQFNYQLYTANAQKHSGSSSADTVIGVRKSYRKHHYFQMQYVWAGVSQKKELNIAPYRKRLTIALDSAAPVYPGVEADIRIKVTNNKGRAVHKADLLAYAVNSEFGDDLKAPNVAYFERTDLARKLDYSFSSAQKQINDSRYQLDYPQWYAQFGLDTAEYYKFLYPGDSIYHTAIPTKDSLTQFAPFVVKNGKIEPIWFIYTNYKPIYFGNTSWRIPYSFPCAEPIWQTVIRVRAGEITIRNLTFEPGKKTIYSIDLNSCKECIFMAKPYYQTVNEVQNMNKYLFNIQWNGAERWSYIEQKDRFMPINDDTQINGKATFGPLDMLPTQYVSMESAMVKFGFQPNYNYRFNPSSVEMVREQPLFTNTESFNLRTLRADDFVATKAEFINKYNRYKQSQALRQRRKTYPCHSSSIEPSISNQLIYSLKDKEDERPIVDLILKNMNGYLYHFDGFRKELWNLPTGTYQLIFITSDSSYFQSQQFTVLPNGKTYIKIENDTCSTQYDLRAQYRLEKFNYYGFLDISKKQSDPDTVETQPIIESGSSAKYSGKAIIITGTVTDISDAGGGEPLIGGNVAIKGTTIGAVTDFDGHYSLTAPNNATLVFSFIGLKKVEIKVNGQKTINVEMDKDDPKLEEVVKIGYMVTKREDATAAITSVGGQDINDKPARGVDIRRGVRVNIGTSGIPSDLSADNQASDNSNNTTSMTEHFARLSAIPQSIETRTYFTDCAFWQPTLVTDRHGIARFSTTMPGNTTAWQTFFVATAGRDKTGTGSAVLNSFKPLVAELNVPRFLIQNDSCSLIAETKNYLPTAVELVSKATLRGQTVLDTARTVSSFTIDTITAVARTLDTLAIEYSLRTSTGYADGLKRSIPVFPQGTIETVGKFGVFDTDTSTVIAFDSTAGNISIYAESDELNILTRELEHTWDYSYLCNEQLASKLKSLLALKRINDLLGKETDIDKRVQYCIDKLLKNRNSQGLWGWWNVSETHIQFSAHIASALMLAREAGYKFEFEANPLMGLIIAGLPKLGKWELISNLQFLETIKANADYQYWIAKLDTLPSYSLYQHLQVMRLKQNHGMEYCIDTLLLTMRQDIMRGTHWGVRSCWLYGNDISTTALAYSILAQDSSRRDLLPQIRRYFFQTRTNGYWANTYESCLVIETVLKDILKSTDITKKNSIEITGTGFHTRIDSFPYADTIPATGSLSIRKTGGTPMYFTAYQRVWNSAPEPVSGQFKVTTSFSASKLVAGKAITLTATVTADKDAEYVMIELPIPASCSYLSKGHSYGEVHREYFKEKVSIFVRNMPAGRHEYRVELLPRYTGTFTVNPARAELMYFPTFFGRNGMQKVDVVK